MKIVIPMAGYGKRFSIEGYGLPKPIIDVRGKPMVWWAVKSLPKVPPSDLIFIVNSQHIEEFEVDKILRNTFSQAITIISQEESPTGQATTVLLAKNKIDNDSDLIIYNCDTYAPTTASNLEAAIKRYQECDGFIPVFNSTAKNFSYVKADLKGYIREVAEKKVISNDATVGLYHFRKGSDFVAASEEMIANNIRVNGEFYILPAYQFLVDAGKIFMKLAVEPIHVLGTPDELNRFLRSS